MSLDIEGKLSKFIFDLTYPKLWKKTYKIDTKSYFCGKSKYLELTFGEFIILPFSANEIKSKIHFHRAVLGKIYVSTTFYDQNKKNSNSFFISKDRSYCIKILKLISVNCHNDKLFDLAICRKYLVGNNSLKVFNLRESVGKISLERRDFEFKYLEVLKIKNNLFELVDCEKF